MIPHLPVQEFVDLLRSFYGQYGYIVVFVSALIENTALLGFLLPGNSLVLLGAIYARLGSLNIGLVILLATLGTIAGYHLDYLFGRFFLGNIASWLSKTALGRRFRLMARVRLACRFLNKHGGKAILISHVIGSLRSVIAMGAGITHMNYFKFLFFEVIAATIWTTLFALLGYFAAVEIDRLTAFIQQGGYIVGIVLFVAYLIWRRFYAPRPRRKLRRTQSKAVA